ncbi:MAG: T9SS type A sorting domain-containing protein [Flavobacteriales bacterium]|nr:T9SS type A sorting domain-containing protein [Flavobacteriales bacterium]MCB9205007.1 T9SS type A sorting domain-containing protein [Flavobacteriales bacterium]
MKRLLPYIFTSLLFAQPVLAVNGGDVIGTEVAPLPDWDARIYPNPNDGVFNIMITGSSAQLNVIVFNVIGEKVFEMKMLADHGAKIDLTSLDKGLYVVQIVDEKRGDVRTMRMQVK